MTSYIRPGFLITRVANPILSHLGRFPALIVRGRRSGRLLTVPMGEPFDFGGRRYLVSGRGETHWVRNLRASGRAAFRTHGTTSAFRPTEVFGTEHDSVVGAYHRKLGRRVDRYFAEIPDARGHPVFRMDPIADEVLPGGPGVRS
jgi:hypothetical protein